MFQPFSSIRLHFYVAGDKGKELSPTMRGNLNKRRNFYLSSKIAWKPTDSLLSPTGILNMSRKGKASPYGKYSDPCLGN